MTLTVKDIPSYKKFVGNLPASCFEHPDLRLEGLQAPVYVLSKLDLESYPNARSAWLNGDIKPPHPCTTLFIGEVAATCLFGPSGIVVIPSVFIDHRWIPEATFIIPSGANTIVIQAECNEEFHDWLRSVGKFIKCAFYTINNPRAELTSGNACPNLRLGKLGKLPKAAFRYTVVTVEPPQIRADKLGGTHESPAEHLRRGHWRQLPSKKVWVRECKVGDKKDGVVVHDYKVAA